MGDDVILPCHIQPPVDVDNGTMEWNRPVRPLQDGGDTAEEVDQAFKQRTSLFHDELSRGNISLKLSRVQISDAGTYQCSVPILGNSSSIQLFVGKVYCSRRGRKKHNYLVEHFLLVSGQVSLLTTQKV